MGLSDNNWNSIIRYSALLLMGLIVSCSTVFFDTPQPTDSNNLKTVPKKIRGTWRNIRKDYEESITIDKTSYTKVTDLKKKIPKLKAGSSAKYRIENDRIFIADDDSKTGYPCKILNDTIYFDQTTKETLVLSDSILLRAAKNCYVLNLRQKKWWEIILIRKIKGGEIQIIYPVPEIFMKAKSLYNISVLDSSSKDTTYFHAEFRSKEIEKIIPGDESGILYQLKPDSTFTNPK